MDADKSSTNFFEIFGKEAFERRVLTEQNQLLRQEINNLRRALDEATPKKAGAERWQDRMRKNFSFGR